MGFPKKYSKSDTLTFNVYESFSINLHLDLPVFSWLGDKS